MAINRSSIDAYVKRAPDVKASLKYIGVGLVLFALGATFIMTAEHFYQPSMQQELVALFGVATCASGFVLAMGAQLNLIILRIIRFFLTN